MCGLVRIKEQTLQSHKEIGLDFQIPINCSTLNSEHDWEDLYIQITNQQAYNFNNHN